MEKVCPKCGKTWNTADFLSDASVIPLGMIVQRDHPVSGYYFFLHAVDSCETTFTVPIEAFNAYLPDGPDAPSAFDTPRCTGHCRKLSDLEVCHTDCYHAPYRNFILSLKKPRS